LRNQVDTEDEIVRQIAVVVQSLNGTILHYDGALSASTSIVRDLKLDSLAVMDFVMAVETKFETIIPVESIADVETIGDLAALLRSQPVQPVR
jgi:acyl carrier protein